MTTFNNNSEQPLPVGKETDKFSLTPLEEALWGICLMNRKIKDYAYGLQSNRLGLYVFAALIGLLGIYVVGSRSEYLRHIDILLLGFLGIGALILFCWRAGKCIDRVSDDALKLRHRLVEEILSERPYDEVEMVTASPGSWEWDYREPSCQELKAILAQVADAFCQKVADVQKK
jgi:hypothetical protein